MARIPRKDYAADAVVPSNNEVLKRINNINSPYSVQATGLDLTPADSRPSARAKAIELNSANLDALALNTRVLQGNRAGYVKAINKPASTLIDADIAFIQEGEGTEVVEKYTKQELLDSDNIVLTTP
jgi:hypothetical protein